MPNCITANLNRLRKEERARIRMVPALFIVLEFFNEIDKNLS